MSEQPKTKLPPASPPPLPHPHDNVEPLDYKVRAGPRLQEQRYMWKKEQFKGRQPSQFVDPCEAASKASFQCMDQNNYDRTACMDYFQAYKDCKTAWIERRKEDRRNGSTD